MLKAQIIATALAYSYAEIKASITNNSLAEITTDAEVEIEWIESSGVELTNRLSETELIIESRPGMNDLASEPSSSTIIIEIDEEYSNLLFSPSVNQTENYTNRLPGDSNEYFSSHLETEVDIMERIRQRSLSINDEIPEYRMTALAYASNKGLSDVVRTLIAVEGINVNIRDYAIGFSPLTHAARNGHVDIVRQLLGVESIDIDARCNFGISVLSNTINAGQVDAARVLLEEDNIKLNAKD